MERFKIRMKDKDGQCFFDEVDGEEVFQISGYRFFSHHENGGWRVSDVRTGLNVSASPFYDDAVKAALTKMQENFEKYLKKLKIIPKATWRYREE